MRISVKESIPNNTAKSLDNNKQAYRIFLVSLLKIQNFQSRRAISDIIVSLLLVAMTVIGGIITFGILNDSGVTESVTSEISKPLTFEGGIKMSAYDARDGLNLMGISGIDNDSPTNRELDAGEEFIVLKISNNSPNSIFINDIMVNEVSHTWDSTTTTALTTTPSNFGKFIIIPGDSAATLDTTPLSSAEISGGRTVRIVVELSSSISPDIGLNDAIRIKIDATGFDLQNFIITAGHTR